ncbi:hypothetical protein J3A64_004829 [Pseudarthrobacter sp. PvP004]|uniref:right-handed parallel beta-helix repeat-containing protein n=1 Tax=Pseudarthrobacter sp. PvP004 TaxID=2817850 RepID=UPI001AE87D30|nr:right-handed parallel beta-helix repeat-containing protein [Pseudarthrobacter sp. PvP004]MBP2269289.1 hypothetical protein [Pseudarthrobacter sp. PvP004]
MTRRTAVPWIIAGAMTVVALIAIVSAIILAIPKPQPLTASTWAVTPAPAETATPAAGPTSSTSATDTDEDQEQAADTSTGPKPSGSATGKVNRDAPMSQAALAARPGQGPLPAAKPATCPAATVRVSTATQLSDALAEAAPGTVIQLADGVYEGHFSATVSGTASQRIYLCGGRNAVLDGGGTSKGYVFHLDGASHWVLSGFTIRNGQKGLVADSSNGSVIQNLSVTGTGDEAIHLRTNSSSNLVIGNVISDTGHRNAKFGEGIYIGSAVSNWCTYTNCTADESNYNVITNNDISATTSESIDIKEGTIGGVVKGNRFDGSSMTDATAWINVKGNAWTIEANYGQNSPENGYETHQILQDWGDYNHFAGNTGTVNGSGYGIASWPPLHNTVSCTNALTGSAKGLSNIPCTP